MALFNQSHIQEKSYLHILKDSEGSSYPGSISPFPALFPHCDF